MEGGEGWVVGGDRWLWRMMGLGDIGGDMWMGWVVVVVVDFGICCFRVEVLDVGLIEIVRLGRHHW